MVPALLVNFTPKSLYLSYHLSLKIKVSLGTFASRAIFSNFSGNAIGENVEEGVLEFKKNKCDGFIAAWLPGTEGTGVADVLFGDFDFLS